MGIATTYVIAHKHLHIHSLHKVLKYLRNIYIKFHFLSICQHPNLHALTTLHWSDMPNIFNLLDKILSIFTSKDHWFFINVLLHCPAHNYFGLFDFSGPALESAFFRCEVVLISTVEMLCAPWNICFVWYGRNRQWN